MCLCVRACLGHGEEGRVLGAVRVARLERPKRLAVCVCARARVCARVGDQTRGRWAQ